MTLLLISVVFLLPNMNVHSSIICLVISAFVLIKFINGSPSCLYPPCRFNVIRNADDSSNVVVSDNSNHSINWTWDVKGGRWDVVYKYQYPGGWYEGKATFINCSASMIGKEQAFVSWGYAKNWESNAVPIYANAWNISYNGDLFGFVPSGNGRYVFRIYSKNRRHNPFNDDYTIPATCTLNSNDKVEMAKWWAQRKSQRNCPEPTINYSWNTNRGRWRVSYKWFEYTDRIEGTVWYRSFTSPNEIQIIRWELDDPKKTVTYTTNPVRIQGENAWQIAPSPTETWGFSPTGNGEWVVQHISKNLVFQPFRSLRGNLQFM